jgi:hypothetical protein
MEPESHQNFLLLSNNFAPPEFFVANFIYDSLESELDNVFVFIGDEHSCYSNEVEVGGADVDVSLFEVPVHDADC